MRVLVLDDDGAPGAGSTRDTVAALEREPDIHVALHTTAPALGDRTLRTVRIVSDLEAHLATDGVDYDVVVISGPHGREVFRDVVSRYLPDARVISDAGLLVGRA
jgi:hypothetical protein